VLVGIWVAELPVGSENRVRVSDPSQGHRMLPMTRRSDESGRSL